MGHGRKPPAPPPHRSNGRPCRVGRIIGAVILIYVAAAVIGMVTA